MTNTVSGWISGRWICAGAVLAMSAALVFTADAAHASDEHGGGHTDPFGFVIVATAFVLVVAMVGRGLATRFGQAAVLGELLLGVVVGNVGAWLGMPAFVMIMHLSETGALVTEVWRTGAPLLEVAQDLYSPAVLGDGHPLSELMAIMTGPEAVRLIIIGFALWAFSSLGVLLLLFMVGLETSVEEMRKVGGRALSVAVLGVVAPFTLGLGITELLLPTAPLATKLFIGATLCATSVGITARVFRDLGQQASAESRIILGAAVIDDVLGLIVLALVVGIAATGEVHLSEVARLVLISGAVLGAIVLVGPRLAGQGVRLFQVFDQANVKLLFPLTLLFALAWLANQVGLAAIVGAFAAGLILSDHHFDGVKSKDEAARKATVATLVAPLETIFAPIFFVLIGMQVNLMTFLEPGVVGLAAGLTLVAILGKWVAGLGAGRDVDRTTVGLGMVPRGEVGLIFASVGKGIGVLSGAVFSSIVIMVIVTTIFTPVALRWSLARRRG